MFKDNQIHSTRVRKNLKHQGQKISNMISKFVPLQSKVIQILKGYLANEPGQT